MNLLRNSFLKTILLLGFLTSHHLQAEQVIFSEIHYNAKAGLPDFIEITNNTATPFDTAGWFFSDGIVYTFPDFDPAEPSAHILKHHETILVSPVEEAALRSAYPQIPAETRIFGPYAGALDNSGETLTLSDKNGIVLTTLEYNDGGKWPAAADGTGHTLIRINPNRTNAGWRNWTASARPGGTPGVTPANSEGPPSETTRLINLDSTWKYDQNTANADLGSTWREPDYDDSHWPAGPGLFGVDPGETFATPWTTGGRVTYYLRHHFRIEEGFSAASIDLRAHIDDGAVVYLNGQEITRFNLPAGEINFDTLAVDSREWGELVEMTTGTDVTNSLRVGDNVLAVEVHNRTAGNNDIVFGTEVDLTLAALPFDPPPGLVISEFHFDSEGLIDWVELHAPGDSPVAVDGMTLTTTRSFTNSVPISGSVPARGYQSFPVSLAIDENGDVDLFLVKGEAVVAAARLNRGFNEESFQSLPVGEEWFGSRENTRNAPNNPASWQTSIVINEIMYDAPSDHVSAEFIELYNRGNETVDLSGWEFTDGIRFEFPPGTTMAPGQFLVVAADADHIRKTYGAIRVLGNWSGGLADRGELLRLEDRFGHLVDEVDYLPEGDWPNRADGDGSSMELRHPDMNNNVATAWADSDESEKSTMQTFTYTSDFVRSNFNPVFSGQELHAHLVGDAHLILENISVELDNNGNNLLRNPDNMSPTSSSASGWVCQGNHHPSFFDGAQLNLISTGHGDNKANRAEVDFAISPVIGNSYTLSFDARWIYGKSRLIIQTLDHGFGTSFLIPIPENLGTPGAPNSAATESPAPTVTGVIHQPAVPKSSQGVTVSAQVESTAPGLQVDLVYRLDTNTGNGPWLRAPMGPTSGGLHQAIVNNFTNQGNIVQFYVEATVDGVTTTQPRFGAARPAMWVVDDREMPDTLLQHRFIVSQYDLQAFNVSLGNGPAYDYNFPRMSNQYFNATFIANESEIYYNAEIRKSGSPFTRSSSIIDQGKWKLPGDRLFRGRGRNVLDRSGSGEGTNPTPRFYDDRLGRFMLYQLGHPTNEMEFIHSVINTGAFKRHESQEPISNDFLRRNFPDGTKGTLLRMDDHWRFDDNGNSSGSQNADWSYKDTENPIAYHSPFLMRSQEAEYNYGPFIELTRLLDENRLDPEILGRVTDSKMLALNAAVRGYNGDWDTITLRRGKNGYFYRPKEGDGWMLIHWDGDRVFGNTGEPFLGNLPGVGKYFSQPFVRRQFNYFLTKLLDEHTRNSARTVAWMDAEIEAVEGSGIPMPKSHYLNWFNNRESGARNFITSAVANTSFAITTSNSPTSANLLSLNGTAPPTIFSVRLAGQPDATVRWVDRTSWEISGVFLREGINNLTIEGLDHDGKLVEQLAFSINKTTNAPPVVQFNSFPDTPGIPVGQSLLIDGIGSFDPEGNNLNFEWSVLPETEAELTAIGNTLAVTFARPGFYVVTANVSDGSQSSTRSMGVTVYQASSFTEFNSIQLDEAWTPINAERQENSSDGAHYSLEERDGRLVLSIPFGQRSIGLPEPVLPDPVTYLDFGATWKYDDSGQELTGTFAQPSFDDSAWASGPGFLGFNEAGLPGPGMQTDNLTRRRIAYYFRHEFEFTDDPIGAQLSIDHIVDDGVRYYLNGQVLGSIRLPDGPITSTTPAESLPGAEEDIIAEGVISLDASAYLVNGTNVLAAEVHNASAGSSDLVFGARVAIAANPISDGPPNLDKAPHPWITRTLPEGDWILETELKMETSQFADSYAGLLVSANQDGMAFRYGVGFVNGSEIAAFRVNPSGSPETLGSEDHTGLNQATIRLERKGNVLNFEQKIGGLYQLVHQLTLPAGTTFGVGGIFASTESDQSLEVSFGHLALIGGDSDFSDWMVSNGLTDPNAEYLDSGMSNLLAYALGRDLNPSVAPAMTFANGTIGFSHRQRIQGGQVTYRVERSTDLINWEAAGDLSPVGDPVANPDGTFTVNLLSSMTAASGQQNYYRLVVTVF